MQQRSQLIDSLRPSTRLLGVALFATVLAVCSIHLFAMGLYSASFRGPGTADASLPRSVEPTLVVAIGRSPGGSVEWMTYAAVFSRLQRDLARPVVLSYAHTRSSLASAVADGDVDLALVPVSAYLQLDELHEATLVASPYLGSVTKERSVLVVRASSRFHRLADLAGGSLSLVAGSLADPPSAEWIVQRYEHRELTSFFRTVRADGSRQENLRRVAAGKVDATCVERSDLSGWPAGSFRVLAESPEYGTAPIVARSGIGPDVIEKMRASLLGSRDVIPAHSAVGGFVVPKEADYAFVRSLTRTPQGAGLRWSRR